MNLRVLRAQLVAVVRVANSGFSVRLPERWKLDKFQLIADTNGVVRETQRAKAARPGQTRAASPVRPIKPNNNLK